MMMKLGLPYQGSKRKISYELMVFMIEDHKKVFGKSPKYFHDIFGGGASMSLEAIQTKGIERVFYNELNTGVVELLKDVVNTGVDGKYYEWIDRKTFHAHKNKDNWLGGFCKVIWSFGNNQKHYSFGKDREQVKQLLHSLIVDGWHQSLVEVNRLFNTTITNSPRNCLFDVETIQVRRKRIIKELRQETGQRIALENLEAVEQLERLANIPNLDRLNISNLSYSDVVINTPIDETIVYLDPPYKNTRGYQSEFNSDELKKFIKKSVYNLYVSEYQNTYDLPLVFELFTKSTFGNTNNKRAIEKVYKYERKNRDNKKVVEGVYQQERKEG